MGYNDPSIKIERAENGYTVEVRAPYKNPKDKGKMMCCGDNIGEKEYVAKDAKEVSALIAELLPKLDMEFKSENEFDAACKDAMKMEME